MSNVKKAMLFLSVACISSTALAAQEDEVATAMRNWVVAYCSNDVEAIAANYHPDARLWGTAAKVRADGQAAVRRYYEGTGANIQSRCAEIKDSAIRVYGSAAVNTGSYEFRATLKDGSPRVALARFSFTYVKLGDRWLIVDHHSSQMPSQ
jgi:uncharacterized protein (TIGR02246 family)